MFGASYGVERTSNIDHLPPGQERSEVIRSLLAGLSYVENIPNFQANMVARAERRDYVENVYNDENLYDLNAALVWAILPQQLVWNLEDRYTYLTRDITAPEAPSNRVSANVLETGPDYFTRLTPVNTLVVGARYGRVYFGELDADNDRYRAHGRLLYLYSPLTTLSLNYEVLRVVFENEEVYDNFLRRDTFFSLESHPSRSRFLLDLGMTSIDRERGDEVEASLARLTWSRELSTDSDIGVFASHELTDAGSMLLTSVVSATAPQDTPVFTVDFGALSGDILNIKRGEIFYNRMGSTFGANVRAFEREIDYETSPEDRTEKGSGLVLHYLPSGVLTFNLFFQNTDIQYANLGWHDEDVSYGVRCAYRAGRDLTLVLEGRRIERDSSEPSREYLDRRAMIALVYGVVPSAERTSRR
jgi:hypothetical protein